MNKNNIFLRIAVISLLGVSSISFSMKKDSPLEDTKHVYKLFKLSKKDLESYTTFQKLSPYKNLMLSKETKDGQEKLFVCTKDDEKNKNDEKNFEEVTSFKFNKNGNILFCNHGNTAEIINVKTNESFKVGEALKFDNASNKNYKKYGFTYDNKYAFIVYTKIFRAENIPDIKINMIDIIDLKTGNILLNRKLKYNIKEEHKWILGMFVAKQNIIGKIVVNIFTHNDDELYDYKPENKM